MPTTIKISCYVLAVFDRVLEATGPGLAALIGIHVAGPLRQTFNPGIRLAFHTPLF